MLKRDFVIPAGTTFDCIDGTKKEYVDGNYEATIATSKDTTMSIVICEDELHTYQDLFEAVKKEKVLDVKEMAKWVRNKLAMRGLKSARIDERELAYIFNLEAEYMKENGIIED